MELVMMEQLTNRRRDLGLITLSAVLALAMIGCSPWATYPRIDGAAQIGQPQFEPLPSIMATAVSTAHGEFGVGNEPVFNLPEGAPAASYHAVITRMGGVGRPMRDADEPAIHITEVRIRALDAEVDVIVPRRGGSPELVTYKLRQHYLHNYRVTDTRRWRIATEFPPPHYVSPEEELARERDAEAVTDEVAEAVVDDGA